MSKSYALFAAILMIAVGGIVVFNDSDNADAQTETTTTGLVKVNYYNGSTWSATTVDAFDVYQAVVAAQSELHYTVAVTGDNDTYNTLVGSGAWAYYDIDADYGTLATVNESTNFSVKVYNGSAWVVAQPALGWYRPFADYAEKVTFANEVSAGAANVAIIAGSSDATPVSETISFTAIEHTSDFAYTFTFTARDGAITDSSFVSGRPVTGYGSDAYLALCNALGNKVVGQNVCVANGGYYNTYYSWIDTIFNAGTVTEYDEVYDEYTYTYWASYSIGANGVSTYLDYTLGYYSTLFGAPNSVSQFKFAYEVM